MTVFVCPLSALDETLSASRARCMVSLSGPGKSPAQPSQIDSGYLALEFNDIGEIREGLIAPNASHIKTLIGFFQEWNPATSMLIHCWMGVSRSTAAALIASATVDPAQDMMALARKLRHVSPMATPNPLMISLADTELGLDGALANAVRAIGRGVDASQGVPFSLEMPTPDQSGT